MEEETKESVVLLLLETFDKYRGKLTAASSMLAALEKAERSLTIAVRSGLSEFPADEIGGLVDVNPTIVAVRAAIASARAAGIKTGE